MTKLSKHHQNFLKLINYLARVPPVVTNETPWGGFGSGDSVNGWWVKFSIDIDHHLAWHAVQELGFVLNEISMSERLPTVFKPVSPPPYLNGGPKEYLSWVIECHDKGVKPGTIADWLEGRLPQPVEDPTAWPDNE